MKVISLDGNSEYNLIEEQGNYFIYYNQSECWNINTRGTLAFSLVNTGNGFKITQKHKGKLDYSESFLLYLLLRLEYKDYDIKIGEFKEL